jgi:hypothetical protein
MASAADGPPNSDRISQVIHAYSGYHFSAVALQNIPSHFRAFKVDSNSLCKMSWSTAPMAMAWFWANPRSISAGHFFLHISLPITSSGLPPIGVLLTWWVYSGIYGSIRVPIVAFRSLSCFSIALKPSGIPIRPYFYLCNIQ